MNLRVLSVLIAAVLSVGVAAPSQTKWPAKDGEVVLKDFKFGTGETLPELKLHYLTLGEPHRNAAGRVDNAVLLLHGTGGNDRIAAEPGVFRCAVCAGRGAGYCEVLHHPAG